MAFFYSDGWVDRVCKGLDFLVGEVCVCVFFDASVFLALDNCVGLYVKFLIGFLNNIILCSTV